MTFSYENSQHADVPEAKPADTAQPEPSTLGYENTHKPGPKGAADQDVPQAVRELRTGDSARALFSPQKTYAEVLPVEADAPNEIKTAAAEFREIMADWELGVPEARELVGVYQGLKEIPTSDVVASWEAQAETELRRTYGEGAKQALADAQALVARDPRLQGWLNATGLGSHPTFVMHAARTARSQRGRGRLK